MDEILIFLGLFSEDAVERAAHNIITNRWPLRLLEILVPLSGKEQLESLLDYYLLQVDPGEEVNKVQYATLISKIADRMGAADMLVHLHSIEDSIPLKRAVDAIQICLVLPAIFKPDILANALQQLLNLPKLPTMLLRTMIQCCALHKPLSSFVVGLLARLIPREIWTMPKLWDGFVRCVRTLAPSSFAVLLQLPTERLAEVIQLAPELGPGFAAYLQQQSAVVQSRYPRDIREYRKDE